MGVLRETSVLGLRLAGKGGRRRTFVIVIIEGEDRNLIMSRV